MLGQILVLEQAHADGVAVLAVNEKLMDQFTLDHKAELAVNMDRFFILFIQRLNTAHWIEHGKAIVHRQACGAGGETFSLEVGGDDDLELGPAGTWLISTSSTSPAFIAIAFDDKAALALIVNMFVAQIGEAQRLRPRTALQTSSA